VSDEAESAETSASGSVFLAGLGIATLGAAFAAVPAALRVQSPAISIGTAWLALWGASALVIGPAGGALRLARPISRLALSVPFGLLIASGPLLVFARLLKATTHHRPLGGATFALVAMFVVAGSVAVAARILVWSATSPLGRLAAGALALGCLALVALVGAPIFSPMLRTGVLDALLAMAAIGAGAFARIGPLERIVTRASPVLWILAVGAGLALLGKGLAAALGEASPVLLGLAGWIRG
jgi:hypothetical protein